MRSSFDGHQYEALKFGSQNVSGLEMLALLSFYITEVDRIKWHIKHIMKDIAPEVELRRSTTEVLEVRKIEELWNNEHV